MSLVPCPQCDKQCNSSALCGRMSGICRASKTSMFDRGSATESQCSLYSYPMGDIGFNLLYPTIKMDAARKRKTGRAVQGGTTIDTQQGDTTTSHCPAASSRSDKALGAWTRRFMALLLSSKGQKLDLNLAAEQLDVQKRRIYDITNVMEGIGLIEKLGQNMVKWVGKAKPSVRAQQNTSGCGDTAYRGDQQQQQLQADVLVLQELEQKLNVQITSLTQSLQALNTDPAVQPLLYVSDTAIKTLPCFGSDTLFAVRAPPGTTLEVSDPNHPTTSALLMQEGGHANHSQGPSAASSHMPSGPCCSQGVQGSMGPGRSRPRHYRVMLKSQAGPVEVYLVRPPAQPGPLPTPAATSHHRCSSPGCTSQGQAAWRHLPDTASHVNPQAAPPPISRSLAGHSSGGSQAGWWDCPPTADQQRPPGSAQRSSCLPGAGDDQGQRWLDALAALPLPHPCHQQPSPQGSQAGSLAAPLPLLLPPAASPLMPGFGQHPPFPSHPHPHHHLSAQPVLGPLPSTGSPTRPGSARRPSPPALVSWSTGRRGVWMPAPIP
ncbi:hypothetical protein V8C86DRAFT_1578449 [Haematococcus lacustris]